MRKTQKPAHAAKVDIIESLRLNQSVSQSINQTISQSVSECIKIACNSLFGRHPKCLYVAFLPSAVEMIGTSPAAKTATL